MPTVPRSVKCREVYGQPLIVDKKLRFLTEQNVRDCQRRFLLGQATEDDRLIIDALLSDFFRNMDCKQPAQIDEQTPDPDDFNKRTRMVEALYASPGGTRPQKELVVTDFGIAPVEMSVPLSVASYDRESKHSLLPEPKKEETWRDRKPLF